MVRFCAGQVGRLLTPAASRVVERIRLLEQMAALQLLALPHRPGSAA
jgi:hypothetical protein